MYPFLFKIGNFPIGTYGVMIAIGLLIGVAIAVWRGRQNGIEDDIILDLVFYGSLAGIIGGRLFYIILNFGDFLKDPATYIFSREGFVFIGGFLVGLPVAIIYLKKKKQDMWLVLDVMMPSLALAHAFGRIGCLFAGCCYGAVCNLPWAVKFPQQSLAFWDHLNHGLIENNSLSSLPVHPTQIYEAITNFLIFIILMLLWKKIKFRGQITAAYLFLYSIARFSIEYFRGDNPKIFFGIFTTTQFICLFTFTASIIIYKYKSSKNLIKQ